MSIGNFREGKEAEEAKETKEQSQEIDERPRNQILQTPEDYDDDFDSLMDEDQGSDETNEENSNCGLDESEQDSGKKSFLERIKSFFDENKESESQANGDMDNENLDTDDESKSDYENDEGKSFRDSFKVTMSPDEVKAYNAEHGVYDISDRPSGGIERERGFDNTDPRRNDFEDDGVPENEENSSNDIGKTEKADAVYEGGDFADSDGSLKGESDDNEE